MSKVLFALVMSVLYETPETHMYTSRCFILSSVSFFMKDKFHFTNQISNYKPGTAFFSSITYVSNVSFVSDVISVIEIYLFRETLECMQQRFDSICNVNRLNSIQDLFVCEKNYGVLMKHKYT